MDNERAINAFPNEWGQQTLFDWERELPNPPERAYKINIKHLLPQIGAYGTAGGSLWRQNMEALFWLVSDELGIPFNKQDIFFDPVIVGRPWTDQDAANESMNLLSDSVILHGVEEDYSSVGSMLELGFLAAASLLKGRKTISYIEEAEKKLGEAIARARSMCIIDAEYMQKMVPEHFILYPRLKKAAERAWEERVRFLAQLNSPIEKESVERILPRHDIESLVCISGTSKDLDSIERLRLKLFYQENGIEYHDTVKEDWNLDYYEKEELPKKDKSLVNLVLITDKESYGAVKDVGLAVFRAVMNGTYAVIYFPSDKDDKSDYSRARKLAKSHFHLLTQEFPWINHYVRFVDNIEEAQFCTKAMMEKAAKSS
jgi:hypothetical protein